MAPYPLCPLSLSYLGHRIGQPQRAAFLPVLVSGISEVVHCTAPLGSFLTGLPPGTLGPLLGRAILGPRVQARVPARVSSSFRGT